jgi:hypothetical protein
VPASVWYEGESLKQLLQGAALGAFATLGIGFSWGGFMLGSTAKTLADSTASSAVVAAIAPICVDQFQHSTDAANNLTELKKTDSWQQAAYVEKGGWATMEQSGRFRRIASLRRHSQRREIATSAACNTTGDAPAFLRITSCLDSCAAMACGGPWRQTLPTRYAGIS